VIHPTKWIANMGLLPCLGLQWGMCLAVEIYPVGHWQGTGSKLAVSLILSRVARRLSLKGLNARFLMGVAIRDSVQWKQVPCSQSKRIIDGFRLEGNLEIIATKIHLHTENLRNRGPKSRVKFSKVTQHVSPAFSLLW
jgi:hypothetical protein